MFLGVRAVIAKSIERIHRANLINFGIIPLIFSDESDYDKVEQDDEIVIENLQGGLKAGKFKLINKTKNFNVILKCDISDREREILRAGGLLNYIGG